MRHTAENLAALLENCQERQLKKVVAIVSDNAANTVAAVKATNWQHLFSFAHIIKLLVQLIIKKTKAIVKFWK